MIEHLATGAGLAFFLFGLFVFFSAVLGLFRFDYVLNRMHAAAVGDSLGIFCVLIARLVPVCGKDAADLRVPVADQPSGQPPGGGDGSGDGPGYP